MRFSVSFYIAMIFISVLCVGLLGSCAETIESRYNLAREIAQGGNLTPIIISTTSFEIQGFIRDETVPERADQTILHVYIEGDGSAWQSRTRPSQDPTPRNPVALKLAAADPVPRVLYLARPCQYRTKVSADPQCTHRIWTSHRFSPVVIGSLNEAIDRVMAQLSTTYVKLFGYSGGGVAAMLIAAQRSDVLGFATVASPLDHKAWTDFHNVTPLVGSLDHRRYRTILINTRQVHFSSRGDTVVPPRVVESYLDDLSLSRSAMANHIILEDQTHHCCWEKLWPQLLDTWSSFLESSTKR